MYIFPYSPTLSRKIPTWSRINGPSAHTLHTKSLKSYRTVSSSDKRRKVTVQTVKNVLNSTKCPLLVPWWCFEAGGVLFWQDTLKFSKNTQIQVQRVHSLFGESFLDKNTSLYMSKTGFSLRYWSGFDCGGHSEAEKKHLPLKNLNQLTIYWEQIKALKFNKKHKFRGK